MPSSAKTANFDNHARQGARARRAVFLCSSSFLCDGPKVGMQFIAEGLARAGWEIHYVSAPSSLFDAPFASRRGRFSRAWRHGRSHEPVKIQDGLWEYVFRAPVPVDRRILRYDWQVALYRAMAPSWLSRENFDLCVHDTSPAHLYRSLVNARHHVLRLSDIIEGFSHFGPAVVRPFHQGIRAGVYSMAWVVSEGLLEYGRKLRPDLPAAVIPNGVETDRFRAAQHVDRKANSAVFVGSGGAWVDFQLVEAAARRLPAWRFDIYGALKGGDTRQVENLRFHGDVPYFSVPEILGQYEVGLIPFRDVRGRLQVCDRPLKFYQYLAAGLGVASSDVGGLRAGMGTWAQFGNDAESFTEAIVRARSSVVGRDRAVLRNYLDDQSWTQRMRHVMASLALLGMGADPLQESCAGEPQAIMA